MREGQVNEDEFPAPNTLTPYPEATSVVVGNEYYKLSRFLPRGVYLHICLSFFFSSPSVINALSMRPCPLCASQPSHRVHSPTLMSRSSPPPHLLFSHSSSRVCLLPSCSGYSQRPLALSILSLSFLCIPPLPFASLSSYPCPSRTFTFLTSFLLSSCLPSISRVPLSFPRVSSLSCAFVLPASLFHSLRP